MNEEIHKNNLDAMDNEDRQQCSLFLGDLSIFCDERDIEEAFAQFGEIIEVRIQRSRETCRPLSYGFVEFAEPECAEAALISMNNYVLKGRPLRIGWAASRRNPTRIGSEHYDSAATVYVRFVALAADSTISEKSLRELFQSYGPVFDCAIKKHTKDTRTNRIKGYAFVSFDSGVHTHGDGINIAGVDAAYRASLALRDCTVGNVRYRCELGKRLQQQLATSMSEQWVQQAEYACPAYPTYPHDQSVQPCQYVYTQSALQHEDYAPADPMPLTASQVMLTPGNTHAYAHLTPQYEQYVQQQYQQQQQAVPSPQYVYRFYLPAAQNTPPVVNSNVGSYVWQVGSPSSEGGALGYVTPRAVHTVQAPLTTGSQHHFYQQHGQGLGRMHQVQPINTSRAYVVPGVPQYQQQQQNQEPRVPTPDPRPSCSAYFSAIQGLDLAISTAPAASPAGFYSSPQAGSWSTDATTPKSTYKSDHHSAPVTRKVSYYCDRRTALQVQMHAQALLHMQFHAQQQQQLQLQQCMQHHGASFSPSAGQAVRQQAPSRRGSCDSTATASLYGEGCVSVNDHMDGIPALSGSTDVYPDAQGHA